MRLDSLSYRFIYRRGAPHWDSPVHRPELEALVRGHRPGRALDLGCGTGSDALYLAAQGWEVVGLDFVPTAIETARTRAQSGGSRARFVTGDATRLGETGVAGPFDLVLDMGCFHAIPDRLRDGYAAGVAAVTRSGADFWLAGVANAPATWRLLGAHGVAPAELHRRFGGSFDLVEEREAGPVGRLRGFTLYHLARR